MCSDHAVCACVCVAAVTGSVIQNPVDGLVFSCCGSIYSYGCLSTCCAGHRHCIYLEVPHLRTSCVVDGGKRQAVPTPEVRSICLVSFLVFGQAGKFGVWPGTDLLACLVFGQGLVTAGEFWCLTSDCRWSLIE